MRVRQDAEQSRLAHLGETYDADFEHIDRLADSGRQISSGLLPPVELWILPHGDDALGPRLRAGIQRVEPPTTIPLVRNPTSARIPAGGREAVVGGTGFEPVTSTV